MSEDPARYDDDANVPPPERSTETPGDRDVKPENVTEPAPDPFEAELASIRAEVDRLVRDATPEATGALEVQARDAPEANTIFWRHVVDQHGIVWLPVVPPLRKPKP